MQLVVPPMLAKSLARVLNVQIEQYEKTFGTIPSDIPEVRKMSNTLTSGMMFLIGAPSTVGGVEGAPRNQLNGREFFAAICEQSA